jgi:hypothetical protein
MKDTGEGIKDKLRKRQKRRLRFRRFGLGFGVSYDADEYALLAMNTVPIVPAVQSLRSVQAVRVAARRIWSTRLKVSSFGKVLVVE